MRLLRLLLCAAAIAAAVVNAVCFSDGAHIMLKVVVSHNNETVVYQTIEEAYEHVVLGNGDIAPDLAEKLKTACTNVVVTYQTQPVNASAPMIPHNYIPVQWRELTNDSFNFELTVHEIVADEDYAIFPLIKQAKFSEVLDMIEAGKGVNAVDEWGFTPLMRAIAVKQPVVIAALLNCRKARVDIHKQRPSGHTALFYASVYDHPSILRLLLRMRADASRRLLARGSRGSTPLHFACMFGLRKNAEVLLEFGADPEARNEAGATPMDLIDRSLPLQEINMFEQLLDEAIQTRQRQKTLHATAAEL